MRGAILLVWVGLAGIAGFALFNITFKVEQLENELSALNKQILKEQNTIHVLRAEWSFLNRPANIEGLAHELLPELRHPQTSQIGGIEDLTDTPKTAPDGLATNGLPISKAAARNGQ